jgi:hypothetical protein
MPFVMLMVWRKSKAFLLMVQYPDLSSAIRPLLLSEDLPVPKLLETWSVHYENESDVKCNDEAQHGLLFENHHDVDSPSEPSCLSTDPHLISEADLNDLVCDLNLSKKSV